MPRLCLSGPIVTGKVNTSEPKSGTWQSEGIRGLKLSGLDLATLNERWLGLHSSLVCRLLTPGRHVMRAAQEPVDVDERQANAVSARIELDLRIGAALTRLQTLSLQSMGAELQDLILSYGKLD